MAAGGTTNNQPTYEMKMTNGDVLLIVQQHRDFVKGLIADGFTTVFTPIIETPLRGACGNCNGAGYLTVFYSKARPTAGYMQRSPVDTDIVQRHDGSGWVQGYEKHFPCPACADHLKLIQIMMRKTGLNERETGFRLDFFNGEPHKEIAVRHARRIVTNAPLMSGMFILYGDHGLGKSGILQATTAQLAQTGVHAVYRTAQAVIDEINSSYKHGADAGVETIIARYVSVPFLAIDEIGRTSDTQSAQAHLFEIVDGRYRNRHRCATGFATNLNLHQLDSYFESRMDADGCAKIQVGGRDLRSDWQHNPESETKWAFA